VQVLIDERLAENAEAMGQLLRSELQELASRTDRVKLVRGKGLLNAVVIAEHDGVSAWDVCMRLKDNGILVRPFAAQLYQVPHVRQRDRLLCHAMHNACCTGIKSTTAEMLLAVSANMQCHHRSPYMTKVWVYRC